MMTSGLHYIWYCKNEQDEQINKKEERKIFAAIAKQVIQGNGVDHTK